MAEESAMQQKTTRTLVSGFTLIEMMVAVALFSIVMLISIEALVGIVDADRKAQSIEAVVDNLDFTLDDMSRSIRTGTTYHCSDSSGDSIGAMGDPTSPQNCPQYGSSYIAFHGSQGVVAGKTGVYWYSATCENGPLGSPLPGYAGGCIERSTQGGASNSFLPLTSPDIAVDSLRFYAVGTGAFPVDTIQPRVLMTLTAHVTLQSGAVTTLHLQSSVTQRLYDE